MTPKFRTNLGSYQLLPFLRIYEINRNIDPGLKQFHQN